MRSGGVLPGTVGTLTGGRWEEDGPGGAMRQLNGLTIVTLSSGSFLSSISPYLLPCTLLYKSVFPPNISVGVSYSTIRLICLFFLR